MYARVIRLNVPLQSTYIIHTHHVAHLPQSNGGSGLNDDSDTWRHLAIADLQLSVNPERSTM